MELKEKLEIIASKQTADERDNYGDWGGNYDDAYYAGTQDGEIWLARYLLDKFF